MEDHHVDRPEVYAQQCAQLTGPNRSIDRSIQARRVQRQPPAKDTHNTLTLKAKKSSQPLGFAGLVAIARGNTPDPIPNSDVKTLRANGTASQDAGE